MGRAVLPTDQDPALDSSLEPNLSLGPSEQEKDLMCESWSGQTGHQKRLKTARQAEAHSTTRA